MRHAVEVLLVTVTIALAQGFGYQARFGATSEYWLIVGIPTLALGLYALVRMGLRGELASQFLPQGGDLSWAALGTCALYALAFGAVHRSGPLAPLTGEWVLRVYLQWGDPADLRAHKALLALGVVVMALAEEALWRGHVQWTLARITSVNRAFLASTLLYTVSRVPTLFVLATGSGRPNPLMVLAALAGGAVWGGITVRLGRLAPAVLSHALFNWAVVAAFRFWGPAV
jgi:membrane protease YdiL (CAAX protease family)